MGVDIEMEAGKKQEVLRGRAVDRDNSDPEGEGTSSIRKSTDRIDWDSSARRPMHPGGYVSPTARQSLNAPVYKAEKTRWRKGKS